MAIPSLSPNGNSLFSLWRRLDDEAMVMIDQLQQLSMLIKTTDSQDPYWRDMISFSSMVSDEFKTRTMVLDVYGHQTYVKKFIFPSKIFMEVINYTWVQ
ncbi:hypothetical protein SLA2020_207580 [Shorea laevis]